MVDVKRTPGLLGGGPLAYAADGSVSQDYRPRDGALVVAFFTNAPDDGEVTISRIDRFGNPHALSAPVAATGGTEDSQQVNFPGNLFRVTYTNTDTTAGQVTFEVHDGGGGGA